MRQQQFISFASLLILLASSMTWTVAADSTSSPRTDQKPDGTGDVARSAPVDSGDTNAAFWKHLTDQQQLAAVTDLKAFARKASEELKHPLRLQESRDFLLYSDLSESEAAQYSVLLERMYTRLCELFGVERGQNLWRGKALFFVFAKIEDYRLYERLVENNDPGESYAMTHCFGDGMVHAAFVRYPDQLQFEHLLVHESVHGFLHRYRSPNRIPSWANEGLADEAAAEVVGNPGRMKLMFGLARVSLEKHGNSVGDFFIAHHIDGWQYPIAETLTAWMIHQNRQGYLNFINGIKDGQTWDESLKKSFKMTPDKLLNEYGKAVGVKELKM